MVADGLGGVRGVGFGFGGRNRTLVPVDLAAAPSFDFALVPRRIQRFSEGSGGDSGDEGHDDEHGEGSLRENFGLETDVEDDEFDKTLAAHQATDGEGFTPEELVGSGSKGSADDLPGEGTRNDSDDVAPSDPIVKETKVGAQTGECEVEGKEEDGDEILNLFGHLDGETTLVGADQADQECAEDGMDTDDVCYWSATAGEDRGRKHLLVKNAEKRTSSKVNATTPCVGPFCKLPVLLTHHMNGGLTANTKNRIHPMQHSNAQRAASPLLLLTKATQSANKIQPVTSFPMPAANTVTPTLLLNNLSSVKIRHRTGNAVMAKAVPMKRPYTPKLMGTVVPSLWN